MDQKWKNLIIRAHIWGPISFEGRADKRRVLPSTIFLCIWDGKYDDQHRNPNMNNKDHQVGQLTKFSHAHITVLLFKLQRNGAA